MKFHNQNDWRGEKGLMILLLHVYKLLCIRASLMEVHLSPSHRAKPLLVT